MKKTTIYTLLCTTIMFPSLSQATEKDKSQQVTGTPIKSAIPNHLTTSSSVLSPFSSADAQQKKLEREYQSTLGTPILVERSKKSLRESGFSESEVAAIEPSVTQAARGQRDQELATKLKPILEQKSEAALEKEREATDTKIKKEKERYEKERAELLATQLDQSSALVDAELRLEDAELRQAQLAKKIDFLTSQYKTLASQYEASRTDMKKSAKENEVLKEEADKKKLELEEALSAKEELEKTVEAIKSKSKIKPASTGSAGSGTPDQKPPVNNTNSAQQGTVPDGDQSQQKDDSKKKSKEDELDIDT